MRTVVSPAVVFDRPATFVAPAVPFRGGKGKQEAEAGHWITVGHGEEAHHLFIRDGGGPMRTADGKHTDADGMPHVHLEVIHGGG